MGWVNRELVAKHHDAREHVIRLLEVLRGPVPEGSVGASNPGGTARSLRTAWRMKLRAENALRESAEVERAAESLRAEIGELQSALQRATAALHESERREAATRGAASISSTELRAAARRQAVEQRSTAVRQLVELRAELDARAEALAGERERWQARALNAEQRLEGAERVLASRRVRSALALGACYDLLRGRR
jgi:chromosome segregation ATPase